MKAKFLLLGALALVISGCAPANEPLFTSATDNPRINVEELFEHDGCKVYRFVDARAYVYFTNCNGSVQSSYTRNCGKNCTETVPVRVQTSLTKDCGEECFQKPMPAGAPRSSDGVKWND
jgi:hypothetical protein